MNRNSLLCLVVAAFGMLTAQASGLGITTWSADHATVNSGVTAGQPAPYGPWRLRLDLTPAPRMGFDVWILSEESDGLVQVRWTYAPVDGVRPLALRSVESLADPDSLLRQRWDLRVDPDPQGYSFVQR